MPALSPAQCRQWEDSLDTKILGKPSHREMGKQGMGQGELHNCFINFTSTYMSVSLFLSISSRKADAMTVPSGTKAANRMFNRISLMRWFPDHTL